MRADRCCDDECTISRNKTFILLLIGVVVLVVVIIIMGRFAVNPETVNFTNINVDTMSYPYGDTDQRVVSTAKALGYKKAFTSRFALNNRQTDSLLLNRCAIMNIDSTRALAQKINGDWDWYGHLKNY